MSMYNFMGIDSWGAGGAEKSTELLVRHLANKGWKVRIYLLKKKDIGVRTNLDSTPVEIKMIEGSNLFKRSDFLEREIRSEKPDIVHSVLFNANLVTRLARRRLKFLHVESLVNMTYSESRAKDRKSNALGLIMYKAFDRWSINRYVDYVHSITHTVNDHYHKELGLDPGKVTVVYRGRNEVAQHDSVEREVVNIVSVGRHEFQKGQIYLVEAMHLLRERNLPVHLTVFGRDGAATPEILASVEKYGLGDYVSFNGYVQNVNEVIGGFDIFAFPSLYEGLGGALIEAQAAGLPIVCSDLPVLREVTVDGRNALYFKPADSRDLADKLEVLINNRNLRLEFGKVSQQNFKKNFYLPNIHEEMEAFYLSCISRFNQQESR